MNGTLLSAALRAAALTGAVLILGQPAAAQDLSPPAPTPTIVLPTFAPAVPPAPAEPVVQPPPAAAPDPKVESEPGRIEVPDEIIVAGQKDSTPGDPLENINAQSFDATQKVDAAIVGPVSDVYRKAVPKPLRSGLRNFLSNLTEPVVFINYLLQLKPGKAAETLGRFTVNSTIGIAGVVDVAKRKPFHLPHRPNGFGYTLGYYGVKPGPFLFLPVIGATTVRDLIGGGIDRLVLPTAVGSPFNDPYYSVSTGVLSALDRRVEIDARLREFREKRYDPYKAFREHYLYTRQARIDELRGRKRAAPIPAAEDDNVIPDPVTPAAAPTGAPPAN